jgi:hypothetical protein
MVVAGLVILALLVAAAVVTVYRQEKPPRG